MRIVSTTAETTNLSAATARLVDTVYTTEGWITPLTDALKDVEQEEAAWKPGPDVASIWEVTAHTANYLESLVLALEGQAQRKFEDWPEVEATGDWVGLRNHVLTLSERLANVLGALSEDALGKPFPSGKTPIADRIVDISAHDAYHAGQIVKLRQVYSALH